MVNKWINVNVIELNQTREAFEEKQDQALNSDEVCWILRTEVLKWSCYGRANGFLSKSSEGQFEVMDAEGASFAHNNKQVRIEQNKHCETKWPDFI